MRTRSPFSMPGGESAPAFTLIELLVVMTIIAILAALILPVHKTAMAATRAATCSSNLREIAVAFQLYSSDNNNLYPAPRYRSTDPAGDTNPTQQGWQTELAPFMSDKVTKFSQKNSSEKYGFCPQFYNQFSNDSRWAASTTGGYGMNTVIAANGWSYRFNKLTITAPSTTVLAGDSSAYYLCSASSPKVTPWSADPAVMGGYNGGDPKVHSDKANYVFADGHVDLLKPEDAWKILAPNTPFKP